MRREPARQTVKTYINRTHSFDCWFQPILTSECHAKEFINLYYIWSLFRHNWQPTYNIQSKI